MGELLILVIGMAVLMILMMIWAAKCYIKCPANKLLVIYGRVPDANTNSGVKIVRNGGVFVWPVIQDYFFLDLKEHKLELSPKFKTRDGMEVKAKVVFTAQISPEDPYPDKAATRLALKSRQMIEDILTDISYGALYKEFEQIDLVELATISRSDLINRLLQAVAKKIEDLGVIITTINLSFIDDAQTMLQNIEEKFQQQKVLSSSSVPLTEGIKELERINEELSLNAKEREDLINQKIALLARMENVSKADS